MCIISHSGVCATFLVLYLFVLYPDAVGGEEMTEGKMESFFGSQSSYCLRANGDVSVGFTLDGGIVGETEGG